MKDLEKEEDRGGVVGLRKGKGKKKEGSERKRRGILTTDWLLAAAECARLLFKPQPHSHTD